MYRLKIKGIYLENIPKPNIYDNGKIYKIICMKTGKIYVGSTCSKLSKRLSKHKEKYREYLKENYHYVTVFDILENGDFKIELIENYPCNSRKELLTRERKYYDEIDCINQTRPIVFEEERKNEAKERISKWKEKNKDKLNCDVDCICGSIVKAHNYYKHLKTIKHQEYIKNQKK